jgi:hypothetical protein
MHYLAIFNFTLRRRGEFAGDISICFSPNPATAESTIQTINKGGGRHPERH